MSSNGFKLLIQQFDFISQKPTLLINNSDRVRSIYGACLTIFLSIFTLIFAYSCLYELFGRFDPNFIISEKYDDYDVKIPLYRDFPIFFSMKLKGDGMSVNNYFSYNISLISSDKTTNVTFSKCDFNKNFNTDNNFELNFNPSDYLCLDYNEGQNFPYMKTKSKESLLNSYITLSAKVCQNSNQCMLADSNLINNLNGGKVEFVLGLMQNMVDIKNTSNPSKIMQRPLYIRQSISTFMKYNLDFNILREEYSTDFGYILTKVEKLDLLSIEPIPYITSDLRMKNNLTDPEVLSLNLKIDKPFKKVYTRKFYKGQQFFAEVGGVFNFLYWIAYNINLIYSLVHFNIKIDNHAKISYFVEKVINNFFYV